MPRRYLLDTGIAQDYQANRRGVRQRAIERRKLGDRIGICVPVLGELWAGVECSASRERNFPKLREALATLLIWPYTTEAAEEYGRIYAMLKQAGRPIPQVDMQIAAVVRTIPNCILVTKDSDFAAISDLTVEDWAK